MDGSDPSCILFLKGRYSYIVVLVFYQDGIGHVSHVVQAVMSYLFLVFRRLTWTDYLFYSSKKIQCFSIQIIFKHEQITVNILTLNNLNLSSPKIVFSEIAEEKNTLETNFKFQQQQQKVERETWNFQSSAEIFFYYLRLPRCASLSPLLLYYLFIKFLFTFINKWRDLSFKNLNN